MKGGIKLRHVVVNADREKFKSENQRDFLLKEMKNHPIQKNRRSDRDNEFNSDRILLDQGILSPKQFYKDLLKWTEEVHTALFVDIYLMRFIVFFLETDEEEVEVCVVSNRKISFESVMKILSPKAEDKEGKFFMKVVNWRSGNCKCTYAPWV